MVDNSDKNNSHNMPLVLASFNMHGFHSNWVYLQDLCKLCDLIVVEEHWLASPQLHYLNDVDLDFKCYSRSSMDNALHV